MLAVWYDALERVLQLVCLRFRSTAFTELEIVDLRHELAVLRKHVSGRRFNQSTECSCHRRAGYCRGRLVVLCRRGGYAPAVAPASGGEPMDGHAPRQSNCCPQIIDHGRFFEVLRAHR